MRLTEGNAAPCQEVSQVRRGAEVAGGGLTHPLRVELGVAEQGRHCAQAAGNRVQAVKNALFVFLQIAVVGQRQALQHRQQRRQIAHHASRFTPHQLSDLGVFLLRHDGAARRYLVAQLEETELAGCPQHDLLGQPREVDLNQGERTRQLHHEVPVRNVVHAILAHAVESQLAGHELTIHRIRRAGQRRRSQGQHVGTSAPIHQAVPIPLRHPEVGQQVVGQHHGLRVLHVGVAGQDGLKVRLSVIQQGFLERMEQRVQIIHGLAQVESQIRGYLVVAAAGGVELPADRADLGDQTLLHPGVDVLRPLDGDAGVNLPGYLLQPGDDLLGFLRGDDAGATQHPGVGDAAAHVLGGHPLIEGQRTGEPLHRGIRPFFKSSTPQLHRADLVREITAKSPRTRE